MATQKISKIVIDRNACIGSATCIVIAPDALELDDKGIAVLKPGAENVDAETLIASAKSCPTMAISLFDENGNKIEL